MTPQPNATAGVPQASALPRMTATQMLVAGFVALVYWRSLYDTNVSPSELIAGIPAIVDLLEQMFPPDWSYGLTLGDAVVETLQIGIIATLLSALLAQQLAFLAAKNVSPHPLVYYPVRFVLTIFRGVSELIWALLFVVAVGLGPFAGVIALVIFCVGVIGKLLAEAIEAVDPRPLEAMTAAGASRWRVFLYGAWPQVMPMYLSYCLYYWDHNTRSAVVLGFVGAGGLGQQLDNSMKMFAGGEVATMLLVFIALVALADRVSAWLRKALG